jgi:hypothetical protein
MQVFSKQWFAKHNKTICWFTNHAFLKYWFRWLLRINHDIGSNEKILKITPSSFTWDAKLQYFSRSSLLETQSKNPNETRLNRRLARKILNKIEQGKIEDKQYLLPARKTDFRTHEKFGKRLYYGLKPLWYLLHFADWAMLDRYQELSKLSFGFNTLTKYPDAGHAGTTVDGYIDVQGVRSLWGNLRATSPGSSAQPDLSSAAVAAAARADSGYYESLKRFYDTYDTSELTSDATISEVVKSLYATGGGFSGLGNSTIDIVSCSIASNNNLVVDDFNTIGSTSFANIATNTFRASGGYKDFTLSAAGRSNVSKTSISKFGAKLGFDFSDSPAGLTWSAYATTSVAFMCADQTGTSQDPKLVVTYTLPVVAPTVTTQAADLVRQTSARGNGNITDNGGGTITEKGICYKAGTSGDPTTADSTVHDHNDTTGAFTESVTGLTAGTGYRFRAYAINSAGTSYGDTVQVTTELDAKVLTDVVKSNGSFIKLPSKLLVSIVLINEVFSKISSILKTLSEVIYSKSIVLSDISKQFIENTSVGIQSFLSKINAKILEEISLVNSSYSRSLVMFRTLIQSVYVNARKETFRAFSFTQRIVIKQGTLIFGTGKLLIASIVASGATIREHIYNEIITNVAKVNAGVASVITRVFTEIAKVFYLLSKSSPKTFSEGGAVSDSAETLKGLWFPESLAVAGEMASFVIAKLFIEVGKVSASAIMAIVLVMSEVITVVSTLIWYPIKVLIEAISTSAELIMGTISKVLIDMVKAIDSIYLIHIFYQTITEAVKTTVSFFAMRLYTFSEIALTGSEMFSRGAKIFIENVKTILSFEILKVIILSFNENAKVGSVAFTQGAKILTESMGASAEFILGTINKVLVEVSKINDVILKYLPKVFTETILTTGNVVAVGLKVLIESIGVAGSFVMGTINKLLIEPVKAIEIYLLNWQAYRVLEQVVGVTAMYANQSLKIFLEGVGVGITFIMGTILKLLVETVKVSVVIMKSLPKVFTEVAKVGANTFTQVVLVFTGSLGVAATIFRDLAKTLTETVVLTWAKIKLVLNGITAGLWSRRPRITGTWKRKSRNDTL